jgi:hypothetical protein
VSGEEVLQAIAKEVLDEQAVITNPSLLPGDQFEQNLFTRQKEKGFHSLPSVKLMHRSPYY